MWRANHLIERIVDRDNLRLAFSKTLRGKRGRVEARQFGDQLELNLRELRDQLWSGRLAVGRFHQFVIRDPKERIITAPCFAERLLHHAVMNVCEPVFDRWLIGDTYACRTGKGRVAALHRTQLFAGRFPAFLKLDIRKYFDSLPHDELLKRLGKLFKDQRVLELFSQIVRSFRGAIGRGLPIGSLTSQHFANFYLGWFDRFVKERLRIRGYVRYMDDSVLWGPSPKALKPVLEECRSFLQGELGLDLKPHPFVNHTRHGMDFLGCRVFPTHAILNRRSRVRFRRMLVELERGLSAGIVAQRVVQERSTALVAFTQAGEVSSWSFRRRVLQGLTVSGQ